MENTGPSSSDQHSNTPSLQHSIRTAGLVLAAGASTRMGRPKALLELRDGTRLAAHQARVLREAGCAPVIVVLGADADRIARELPGETVARNPAWATGRLTSVQAGLRAAPDAAGYLILPVDTVGVRAATLQTLIQAAARSGARAVRPFYAGRSGRVLWISAEIAKDVLAETAGDVRLDALLDAATQRVDTDDPHITRNVNTPDEWERVRATLPS